MSGASIRLPHDDRLARLAATGDRDAFASIYRRHHQGLYRYCRSILGNDEDAADALQNTMASAMQALSGERRDVALKPWLYRVAHNESVSLLRRRRPQATIEAADATPGPTLEGTAESRERLRQLVADLRELPERQRGALLMRELSGLSYADVAAALGVSAGAAKQSVFEARTALHELSEGRAMACDSVRRSISDRDGRVLRGRRVRSHLRDCLGCRDFRDAIDSRGADLQPLAPPLPVLAAAGLLERLLGGGGGDGPGGGLGTSEIGADAALGQAAAMAGAGTGAAGPGGWIAGALGGSVAAKGVATVAATLAVGAGAAGLAVSPGEEARPAAEASGQAPGDPGNAAGLESGDDGDGRRRSASKERADRVRDGRKGSDRDRESDRIDRGDRGDESDAAEAPRGGTRPGGNAPSRERGHRPGRPPSGEDRRGPPAGAERPDGAGPPSGGGLPEPAEQHAGGQVPDQGAGAPGSQAPAGAPEPGAPSLPDRGAGAAPGAGAPAPPDLVPDVGP
ncbi:MAG: sigma-70 family RNA polymerase sigma factor [Thermoleophilaceae bacterium]